MDDPLMHDGMRVSKSELRADWDNPQLEGALAICAELRRRGYRALLAGGCVRDMCLGVGPKDYDIATSARPEAVAGIFPKVIPVGVEFGVQIVHRPEGDYEVATFRQDGPYLDGRHPSHVAFRSEYEDAMRRDFTVNALFYDPERCEVVDYTGGLDDLRAGRIRTVGNPRERFREDYLRLVRAIRFAARLDYRIEPETWAALAELAPMGARTSPERIRDELIKMLTEGHARRSFELLDESGLLEHILPEIARMKGVEQPEAFHPEGDVFRHTLLILGHLDELEPPPSTTVALGALLHDVGKPSTQTFEDRIRFHQHDKVGAEMAREICRRLRFSKKEIDRIVWIVDQHMRLAAAPNMRESKLKRFVREEGFDELLQVARLDCLASHQDMSIVDWLEEYKRSLKPEEVKPPSLLNGRDLIAMGYTPGPLFSDILRAVEDAQLEGRLGDSEQARVFVQKHWPLDSSKHE